ncbi:hypothetical protein [Acinetobacter sp. BSP-28]|uniref:hypothetical protein n=1 Tax=Acinetobacter sp. BSP-28 TaxID=3344661 RepID=UPI00376F82E0
MAQSREPVCLNKTLKSIGAYCTSAEQQYLAYWSLAENLYISVLFTNPSILREI